MRVSDNGIELMSKKIVNALMCRSVPLGEGRHDIVLFAIDGASFNGEDSSHGDANSGEEVQTRSSWHRSGAGSIPGIEVKAR